MLVNGETKDNKNQLKPTYFLEPPPEKPDETTALIILNCPISGCEYFHRLYQHSAFCLCVDGGANRLHDVLKAQYPRLQSLDALRQALPDAIHGDLDSLKDNVRQLYEEADVEITEDPDQYSTDFDKAMKKVTERLPNVETILVLGSIGGRVDQGIGLLHELYSQQRDRGSNVQLWLFSEASVSTVIQPGSTTIETPLKTGLIERNMGILPLYGPANITTKGLEWDVEDWPTEMGGQVSTSNHIVADRITITTDRHVLFTVERAIER